MSGFATRWENRVHIVILKELLDSHSTPLYSAAAFGIKSQAPANSALFNQNRGNETVKPQQSSNIFGAPAQPSTTTSFNALGGTSQPQQQPQTQNPSIFGSGTGVFGQSQQQQQTQPLTTGTFGQPQQQQQPAATGLLGQPAQQQQQPAASTGLFGQPAGQQQQQPASIGLFGQPQQQQQQSQQNTFGLSIFGSSTNQPNQQQQQQQQPGQSTFGGWGSTTTASVNPLQPQATVPVSSGIFGSAPQQQQRQSTYVSTCSIWIAYVTGFPCWVGLSGLGELFLFIIM